MTNLADYSDGFLGNQSEGTAELLKAMQAGQITGRDTANQSLTQEPLKVESLETTLKLLDTRMKDIKLLNKMPKLTAYNTVEEFLQLESYGSDRGGFYNEGELSDVEDSVYKRRSELIKYIQVTGEVTLQAQMVRSYVDAMRKEVENKTMWVLKKANSSLTKGNSDYIPQEWNGIYKQHQSVGVGEAYIWSSLEAYMTSNVIIDKRGKSLVQEDIEEAAIRVDANFGTATDLFSVPGVISALARDYFQDQRILQNGTAVTGTIGITPKAISTTLGDISLSSDKFMGQSGEREQKTTISAATSTKAPNAPVTGGAPAPVADATAKYIAGEAGNAYFAVAGINRYGESAITVLDAAPTAIAAGFGVNLTWTSGGGAVPATAYTVYRTVITGAVSPVGLIFYPIFTVSSSEMAAGYDGAAALSVRDRGRFLPNTETAFVTEMTDDILSFKQLAPISKLDLAVLSMSRRFINFVFATPQMYAPKKMVKFINVCKTLNV